MTRERLKNLRVIEGRDTYLAAQLESLPPFALLKRKEIQDQLDADHAERDAVYAWIEAVPNARTANIIILRFVKNAKWEEIAGYIGGVGADACKKAAMKYIAASEKQEDEAKAAAMAEAMEDVLSEKSNESCKDSAV